MSRALRNYIEGSKKLKDVLIAAKIDTEMAEDFKAVCTKNGWKMTDAVRAGIQKLIDDESDRKEGSFKLPRTINPENKSAWK